VVPQASLLDLDLAPGMTGRRIGSPITIVIAVLVLTSPVVLAAGEGSLSATVRVSPLQARLELSATSTQVGKTFKATAVVTNVGPSVVKDVTVDLRLDGAGLVIERPGPKTIEQIKPVKAATVSWMVCAASPGTYLLLAQATVAGETVESAARVVTVTAGGRRSCP
jgi:hypothetical protein